LRCRDVQRRVAERHHDAVDLALRRGPPLTQGAIPLGNLLGMSADIDRFPGSPKKGANVAVWQTRA
jgi:hypothetical protein